MSDTDSINGQEALARTIWGEARGESLAGQQAVACVVLNRIKSGIVWWGKDIRSVCLMPYQFSCWLRSDPNRIKLLAVTLDDPIYAQCASIANSAVIGKLSDITQGSDSYKRIGTEAVWAVSLTPTVIIGRHEFYTTIKKLVHPY